MSTTDLFRFNLAAPSDASRRSLGNVNDVRVTLHPGEFKAFFVDAAKVSLELGHAKAGIEFAHYRELVTPELAQRFWSILPE